MPSRLEKTKCTKMFLVNTKNQYEALVDVVDQNSIMFGLYKHDKVIPMHKFIPNELVVLIGLLNTPRIIREYIKTDNTYTKKSIKYFYKNYIYSAGLYYYFKRKIPNTNVKYLFFSNDHSYSSRPIFLACNHFIKTIYIPHAHVSKSFPPLESSYALLYGKFMLDTYRNYSSKVFLVGSKKIPKIVMKKEESLGRFGITVSKLDDEKEVRDFIEKVRSNVEGRVLCVRFHPSDQRFDDLKLVRAQNLDISRDEGLYDFFSKIDFLLSGPSSTILDAIAAGLYVFQINFKETVLKDNYGLIAEGHLITEKPNDIIMNIKQNYEHYLYRSSTIQPGDLFENLRLNISSEILLNQALFNIHSSGRSLER